MLISFSIVKIWKQKTLKRLFIQMKYFWFLSTQQTNWHHSLQKFFMQKYMMVIFCVHFPKKVANGGYFMVSILTLISASEKVGWLFWKLLFCLFVLFKSFVYIKETKNDFSILSLCSLLQMKNSFILYAKNKRG